MSRSDGDAVSAMTGTFRADPWSLIHASTSKPSTSGMIQVRAGPDSGVVNLRRSWNGGGSGQIGDPVQPVRRGVHRKARARATGGSGQTWTACSLPCSITRSVGECMLMGVIRTGIAA